MTGNHNLTSTKGGSHLRRPATPFPVKLQQDSGSFGTAVAFPEDLLIDESKMSVLSRGVSLSVDYSVNGVIPNSSNPANFTSSELTPAPHRANLQNVASAQFGVGMVNPLQNGTVLSFVLSVVFGGVPAKIVQMVVVYVSVFMTRLHTFRTRANKNLQNKMVDVDFAPPLRTAQSYHRPSIRSCSERFEPLPLGSPSPASPIDTPYRAIYSNSVERESDLNCGHGNRFHRTSSKELYGFLKPLGRAV